MTENDELLQSEDLPDLEIDIGTKMHIKIEDTRATAKFIGMDRYRFILTSPPSPFREVKERIVIDQHVVVQYIHDGKVYAFRTNIVDLILKPLKIFVIKYPEVIQNHDLRTDRRVAAMIPFMLDVNGYTKEGVITDISEKGCKCLIVSSESDKFNIEVSEIVHMKCRFPGEPKDQLMSGVVKNVSPEKNTPDKQIIGIAFHGNASAVQSIIRNYIMSVSEFC